MKKRCGVSQAGQLPTTRHSLSLCKVTTTNSDKKANSVNLQVTCEQLCNTRVSETILSLLTKLDNNFKRSKCSCNCNLNTDKLPSSKDCRHTSMYGKFCHKQQWSGPNNTVEFQGGTLLQNSQTSEFCYYKIQNSLIKYASNVHMNKQNGYAHRQLMQQVTLSLRYYEQHCKHHRWHSQTCISS